MTDSPIVAVSSRAGGVAADTPAKDTLKVASTTGAPAPSARGSDGDVATTTDERDAYVIPEGFQSWKEPNWRDETPHPLCHVTREQYPAPRECAFTYADPMDDGYEGPCHLGHPANCRSFVNTQLQHERHPGGVA